MTHTVLLSCFRRYPWGNNLKVNGKHMANTWQGKFPVRDTGEDGYAGTAPVSSFLSNGYGLHNMVGNVWEWTTDWWNIRHTKDFQENPVIIWHPLYIMNVQSLSGVVHMNDHLPHTNSCHLVRIRMGNSSSFCNFHQCLLIVHP